MAAAPDVGMTRLAASGNPNVPAWVKQNGQCSKCIAGECEAGECAAGEGAASVSAIPAMSMPAMSMPSMCEAWCMAGIGRGAGTPANAARKTGLASEKPDATRAWEIDGASEASRTAKQAIQAAIRRLRRVIPTMIIIVQPQLGPVRLTILAATDVEILTQVAPGDFSAIACSIAPHWNAKLRCDQGASQAGSGTAPLKALRTRFQGLAGARL